MFKISILFQYKFQGLSWFFYLWTKQYTLSFTEKEISELRLFFDTYIGEVFEEENFQSIVTSSRRDLIFSFFLETNIFLDSSKKSNKYEMVNIANLTYNPSIVTTWSNKNENFLLCKKQHELRNQNKLITQNGKLFSLLKNRKTLRTYSKSDVNNTELLYLFHCMYWNITKVKFGDYDFVHKTTPSWGAFYPLEIFYINFSKNQLLKFDGYTINFVKDLSEDFNINDYIVKNDLLDLNNSIGIVFILADISLMSQKYWIKTYPLCLLEGWHASQNFVLACEELWYWNCELWWVWEENIIKLCTSKGGNSIFVNAILFWKI